MVRALQLEGLSSAAGIPSRNRPPASRLASAGTPDAAPPASPVRPLYCGCQAQLEEIALVALLNLSAAYLETSS
jgi:hypothetical protein